MYPKSTNKHKQKVRAAALNWSSLALLDLRKYNDVASALIPKYIQSRRATERFVFGGILFAEQMARFLPVASLVHSFVHLCIGIASRFVRASLS